MVSYLTRLCWQREGKRKSFVKCKQQSQLRPSFRFWGFCMKFRLLHSLDTMQDQAALGSTLLRQSLPSSEEQQLLRIKPGFLRYLVPTQLHHSICHLLSPIAFTIKRICVKNHTQMPTLFLDLGI